MLTRNVLRVLALAMVATACGGAAAVSKTPQTGMTVSVREVMGVGNVYTNDRGMSLYSPAQEAGGKILCIGTCTSVWIPLAAPASGDPTKAADVKGTLSVITRPDGTRQVALNGAPLYTFFQDTAAGQINGNGISDSFGTASFTWHIESGVPVKSTPAGVPGY
jgi:predicted lipoprotein with Yx(FWY)xxD motif